MSVNFNFDYLIAQKNIKKSKNHLRYNCSATVKLTINDIDSLELDTNNAKILNVTFEYIRNNIVNLKKDYNNPLFFYYIEKLFFLL